MTIMLETGAITRFLKVGNYASYCRKVPTQWTSNDKIERQGQQKERKQIPGLGILGSGGNGQTLSTTAFGTDYNRKAAKTNFMVAHTALAHKLARAAYYIMRDKTEFGHRKIFA